MTKYLIGIALVIVIIYGLIKAWPIMAGPSLLIASPTNNAPFPGGVVSVRGRAERATTVMLNGTPLLHEKNGGFSSTLSFPHGSSILTFVATDRFGRTVTETRTIFIPLEN